MRPINKACLTGITLAMSSWFPEPRIKSRLRRVFIYNLQLSLTGLPQIGDLELSLGLRRRVKVRLEVNGVRGALGVRDGPVVARAQGKHARSSHVDKVRRETACVMQSNSLF